MSKSSDTYRTLSKSSEEILFKEKKSKFFGYAYHIQTEDEVKPIIEAIKKKHHTAGHVCYAWQLGTEVTRYRANDDGEPNNSAGLPIYGQIQAFDVTNVLVAVARIFGGTKLGVGGLISAYRTGAQMALEVSKIEERLIEDTYQLSFGYPEMDKVMRILKQLQCEIISQHMEMNCKLIIKVRKSESENLEKIFEAFHKVSIKREN
jgi:uncharacterized YigZ family protein